MEAPPASLELSIVMGMGIGVTSSLIAVNGHANEWRSTASGNYPAQPKMVVRGSRLLDSVDHHVDLLVEEADALGDRRRLTERMTPGDVAARTDQ